ncbi:MAG TPA: ATP-dependent DNA helicase RecG [Eubacterium sp.]|nr:ATP-dependent DNA helicase RecG [Eubacterium sp.]HAZ86974.1 ATP-dependent DNA helicase RecG [Eubacterium sp.]
MKLSSLKGIGQKTEQLFTKAGITDTSQLPYYYPRGYDIYKEPVLISEIDEDGIYTLYLSIASDVEVKPMKKLNITTVFAVDEQNDRIKLTWFNMPFMKGALRRGYRYMVRGRVVCRGSLVSMEQPKLYTAAEYELKLHYIQPIYPLVKGLTNNMVTKAVTQYFAMQNNPEEMEYLPKELIERYELKPLYEAIKYIHFPRGINEMQESRKRLAFDEFFGFMMKLENLKSQRTYLENECMIHEGGYAARLISELPYQLTEPQRKAYDEMVADMSGKHVMNRLIQGDVGSGKTIIAVLALLNAVEAGFQGALMAPTEVLAKQHYDTVCELLKKHEFPVTPVLLVGSMSASQKKKAHEQIKDGTADIIIGTNALIQEKVEYNNLGFVVTDEQHRFGVNQRGGLARKGGHPHVCVMSATPIPRTLAIILYGDLDISIINAMPVGRLPIKNAVVGEEYRPNAYRFIMNQAALGHQAYVICPMVEDNEISESENVTDYTVELRKNLPGLTVEGLHGQMAADTKNDIMGRFAKGEIQVLVSTTVIEVGINVPNATVMLIENAEKFGLAQLHQLRGRVGRGNAQSYCIFVSTSKKEEAKQRLDIIGKSNDGFYIAEQDLKLRGPGDFFGIRQSGDMSFKLADIYTDADMLKKAKDCADYIIENNLQNTLKKAFSQNDVML